jgi:PhnB protein
MPLMPLPVVASGHEDRAMKLYTQLNFGGNCEEAFLFYAEHLGGKIEMMMKQNQAPGAPADAGNAIIHARMNIGQTILIGNDVPGTVFQRMRSVYLFLSLDSAAEAERVHKLLAEGGEIYMPMEETFYATRFSMLRDRFGVGWSIIHERPR